jgi:uncharacterized protein
LTPPELKALAASLATSSGISGKMDIHLATEALGLSGVSCGAPGDDCAVIPDGDGYLLYAIEGFINGFVQTDPWFAGWCSVMVNLSDILAMGGRPIALVNAIWAPDAAAAAPVLDGMRSAAKAYDIPIVGGHTNLRSEQLQLAVSILGRARALISSFDARPDDVLIAAIDHRGAYRAPFDNWQAALTAPPERLRTDASILPELAEAGLVRAGKDISQGGIPGTALMLAECSGVAIRIDLDAIPLPKDAALDRWLRTFPSFGFLLSVNPQNASAVCARFQKADISAVVVGSVTEGTCVTLSSCDAEALLWDHAATPYLGLTKAKDDA